MLNDAKLVDKHQNLRHGLWAECAATATKIENIVASKDRSPAFRAFFNKDAPYLHALRAFREIGVTHDAKTIRSKLENRGVPSMFVGYADDHAASTYRMLNLEMKAVWKTRDVKWMASDIAQYEARMKKEATGNVTVYGNDSDDDNNNDGIVENVNDADINDAEDEDNDDDDNDDEEDHHDDDHNNNDEDDDGDDGDDDPPADEPINPRALREMKRLQAFFNEEATEYIRDALGHMNVTETEDKDALDNDVESATGSTASTHRSGRATDDEASQQQMADDEASQQQMADGDLDGDQDLASAAIDFLPHFAFYTKNHVVEPVDVGNAFEHRLIEPMTFREAYDHPDPEQRAKWRAAIQKEFHDMN